jgi:hypothetical protein
VITLQNLKLFLGLSIILLLFFGCLDGGVTTPPEQPPEQPSTPVCRMVSITEPYTEVECWNVTYTEQVCERKALEYFQSKTNKVDLCTSDSDCVGKELVNCPNTCAKAMKRCRMNITNLNTKKSGTWTVGATFSRDSIGFEKEPISKKIEPEQTFTFDFTQLYDLGQGGSSLECELLVLDTPVVEFCHDEARTFEECEEVTRYKTIEREVCE